MENAVAVATAFTIGGSTIYATRGSDAWGQIGALCALAGSTLLLALPFLLRVRFFKWGAEYPVRTYLLVVTLVGVYRMLAAAAFVAYLSACASLALQSSILETGTAYILSWGIGFLAVFAPQGIGIFDVVASDLLRGRGSFAGIAALLAGFRLAILVADALVWSCGRLLLGQNSNGDSHSHSPVQRITRRISPTRGDKFCQHWTISDKKPPCNLFVRMFLGGEKSFF